MPQNVLPDYHFLLIAPNLGAEWLFDAARAFWERFTPTVISDIELLRLIPASRTLTVTLVARRDLSTHLSYLLTQAVPHARVDPVVYDFFDDAKLALNERAALNQPFGVPLLPTATIDVPPPPTLTPTPTDDLRTREPAGFVTQMPTATPPPGFITQTPTPESTLPEGTDDAP